MIPNKSYVLPMPFSLVKICIFLFLGGWVTLELDLVGASSPTLPESVSRSRGKDYRSKKWRGNCHDISLNKIQPMKVLNGKPLGESVFGEGITPKLSFVSLKGTSSSKTSLVSKITENVKGNVNPFI